MQGTHRGRILTAGNLDMKKLCQATIYRTSNELKLYEDFLWNIWGILEQISTIGGPPGGLNPPGRAREPWRALVGCAHPGPPPVPIFWYISHFWPRKNKERTFEMERHRLKAELGQEHFCPPANRFCRGNFPPGWETIIITNNSPILGRAISINIFNITISSQTLVHL